MPVSRKDKFFAIKDLPGCGPDEIVFARKTVRVADQEAINNQLLSMSIDLANAQNGSQPEINMAMNAGAVKRATLQQMIRSWTLKEEVELPNDDVRLVDLPQPTEDAEVISSLPIEVADFIFLAIQFQQNASNDLKTQEQQEAFLAAATEPSSVS